METEKKFSGRVLFLDRDDINTDEIIPARYLTEITKSALAPYLLEDLKLEGFDPAKDIANTDVIVTRANFGCGSSREHAPWALEVNEIYLVIGESFARIFRQNMFNCGMMAVELSPESIQRLFDTFAGKETFITTDIDRQSFTFSSDTADSVEISFSLSQFDKTLVTSGGWVEYADENY